MPAFQQNIDTVLSLSTSSTHRPAATSLPGPLWRPQNPAWGLAKMGPGQRKSGLGGSRDLQNWLLDGLEGGLEGSGLAWMAILGVQGLVWTPSWGHLGAREAFLDRFRMDLGVPNGSKRVISWIHSGKEQNSSNVTFQFVV